MDLRSLTSRSSALESAITYIMSPLTPKDISKLQCTVRLWPPLTAQRITQHKTSVHHIMRRGKSGCTLGLPL